MASFLHTLCKVGFLCLLLLLILVPADCNAGKMPLSYMMQE